MKKLLFILSAGAVLFITLIIQSCYVAKPLDREVHVSIDANFPINVINSGNSNFAIKHTQEEYRKSYMDALIQELGVNHVIADNASPEFNVTITSLDLHESTKVDTVKDIKSKDNGMIRELTLAGLKTSGNVVRLSSGVSGNWNADKDKDEQLTNNRSLDQIIAGQNKDGTVYREKNFDDSEFLNLCALTGRRAAVRIEKEIQSLLK